MTDGTKDAADKSVITASKATPAEKVKAIANIPKTKEQIKDWLCDLVNRLVHDWRPTLATVLFCEEELIELCYRARETFWLQNSYIDIAPPVTIVADIHGQFQDLLAIINFKGFCPMTKYVFLGDYVDRGMWSIECVTLLFALKVLYPMEMVLLRGNHESRPVNSSYGFFLEVKRRYSTALYEAFQYAFNVMPFCARGKSTHIPRINPLSSNFRTLSDLVWADPDVNITGYEESPRGAARVFGEKALDAFMAKLNVELVVRGHQVVADGFEFFGSQRKLVTLFSAPSYAGSHDNVGAVMNVHQNLVISFTLFKNDQEERKRKSISE